MELCILDPKNPKRENIETDKNLDNIKFNVNFEYHFKRADTSKNTIHNYYSGYYEDEVYDAKLIVEKLPSYMDKVDIEDVKSKEILENRKILNNYDIYTAFKKDYNKKMNIFTTKEDILYLYCIRAINNSNIPNGKIYHLEGDYEGFIYENDTTYAAHIFNNGDYLLTYTRTSAHSETYKLRW